jgi:copper chaperone CopZ
MIAFQVSDMSCAHCVGAIADAVKGVDPDAKVRIDLARHRVEIEPASAGVVALREAIQGAGYTPVPA